MENKKYARVLTVAGSDSGGGAGIQADIKSISANGCFATSAITALTSQNTLGVTDIFSIPVDTIKSQMRAILSDIGTDAVKIGMLHDSATIQAVCEVLKEFSITNIVLDPVMVATSGHKLLQNEAIETLKELMIPMARVITPNIPEAEILLGESLNDQSSLPQAARRLSQNGSISVLLKAGHLNEDELVDIFYNAENDTIQKLSSQRLYSQNTHGTGCTLSSAFAAFLAKGKSLDEAARSSKKYITESIEAGFAYKIGKGHGPVCHFYNYWND